MKTFVLTLAVSIVLVSGSVFADVNAIGSDAMVKSHLAVGEKTILEQDKTFMERYKDKYGGIRTKDNND